MEGLRNFEGGGVFEPSPHHPLGTPLETKVKQNITTVAERHSCAVRGTNMATVGNFVVMTEKFIITIIIIFVNCNWVVIRCSGYFTYIQNMTLFTNKFKSGGLHEKHVVAIWKSWEPSQHLLIDIGTHLIIF